ncbi:YdcF family protein [Nocardia sp. CA-120079]|uniref:YdcF family protein n=1 Tax=Nocardia sp. CA-120079 TaxID=3239974 RepID=UPI003D9839BD
MVPPFPTVGGHPTANEWSSHVRPDRVHRPFRPRRRADDRGNRARCRDGGGIAAQPACGPRNGVTEAQTMADWLIGHGIPAERVHIEPEAVSTAQNAERSARIMHDIGMRDAVVVTSADHIDRAAALFGDAGIAVVATVTPEKVPPLVWEFGPRP